MPSQVTAAPLSHWYELVWCQVAGLCPGPHLDSSPYLCTVAVERCAALRGNSATIPTPAPVCTVTLPQHRHCIIWSDAYMEYMARLDIMRPCNPSLLWFWCVIQLFFTLPFFIGTLWRETKIQVCPSKSPNHLNSVYHCTYCVIVSKSKNIIFLFIWLFLILQNWI